MSDNRLLQGKLLPTVISEQSSNTEAQVRLALEHMGGRRPGSQQSSQNSHGSAHGTASRVPNGSGATRHRYVREGEVPVVHASLGRPAARIDHAGVQDKSLVDTLRHDFEREHGLREVAERALHDLRTLLTASQTRLAHLEMDLRAAREQLAAQQALTQEAVEAKDAAETLHEQAAAKIVSLTERLHVKADAPVRRIQAPRATQREPQPVKWWIKD